MRGNISGCTARTNDEFREVIKKRMRIMMGIIIIGLITAAIGFSAKAYMTVSISDRMLGVYTGVGVGFFAVGMVLWVKNKILLGNEEKLKEKRLSNTDERIREISNRAFRTAGYSMLIASYAAALIGGLFYPVLMEVLMFIVCIFLLAYIIAFRYYNNKM